MAIERADELARRAGEVKDPPPMPNDSLECCRRYLHGHLDSYEPAEIIEQIEACVEDERALEARRHLNSLLGVARAGITGLFGREFETDTAVAALRLGRLNPPRGAEATQRLREIREQVDALLRVLQPIR